MERPSAARVRAAPDVPRRRGVDARDAVRRRRLEGGIDREGRGGGARVGGDRGGVRARGWV